MGTGERRQSFWSTAPGILTAAGTVITAVTGLLIAVDQAGLLDRSGSTAESSVADPSSSGSSSSSGSDSGQAPVDGEALVGSWRGTAAPAGGGASFVVRLEIRSPCRLRKPCGSIFVGSLPCSGRSTLWAVHGETFELATDHFEPPSAAGCTPGAGDFFRLQADGTLRYTTGYDDVRGVLVRAAPSS